MKKSDIVAEISKTTGKKLEEVMPIVNAFIKTINKCMTENKPVFIRKFGTFNITKRKEKLGRNISKGTTVIIPSHYLPTFAFCKTVKKEVKNCVKDSL